MSSADDLTTKEQWVLVGYQVLSGAAVYISLFVLAYLLRYVSQRAENDEKLDPVVKYSIKIKKYTGVFRSNFANLFYASINGIVCIFFISRSYTRRYDIWMRTFESVFNLCFALQIVVEFASSFTKVLYILKFTTATNIFALASSIYAISTEFYIGLQFIRSVNVIYHIERIKVPDTVCNRVFREFLNLTLTVIAYVFLYAGGILIFETLGDPPGIGYESTEWTIFNSFYFMIVTFSTVGYGDFFATTFLGRILMMFCIALGIIAFGAKTSELLSVISADSKGLGRFSNPEYSDFVVLMGDINEEILKLMLNQLLHSDRVSKFGRETKIVVLVPTVDALDDLRGYIASGAGSKEGGRLVTVGSGAAGGKEKHLEFLVGSPLEHDDLRRCQVENSEAVYILSPEASENEEAMDLRQLFTAVAVRRYLKVSKAVGEGRHVPVKVTVSQRRHWVTYQHPLLSEANADVDVVCYDKLIMSLLSSSCFAPGYLTFLSNLVNTVGDKDLAKGDHLNDPDWLQDYLTGACNEIHVFYPLPSIWGKEFWSFHEKMLERNILLLGYVRKNGHVFLAPRDVNAIIPRHSLLVTITQTVRDVEDLTDEQISEEQTRQRRSGGIPLRIAVSDEGLLKKYHRVKIRIRQDHEEHNLRSLTGDQRGSLAKLGKYLARREFRTDSDTSVDTQQSDCKSTVSSTARSSEQSAFQNLAHLYETDLIEFNAANTTIRTHRSMRHEESKRVQEVPPILGERVAKFCPFALEVDSLDAKIPLIIECYGSKEGVESVELVAKLVIEPSEFKENMKASREKARAKAASKAGSRAASRAASRAELRKGTSRIQEYTSPKQRSPSYRSKNNVSSGFASPPVESTDYVFKKGGQTALLRLIPVTRRSRRRQEIKVVDRHVQLQSQLNHMVDKQGHNQVSVGLSEKCRKEETSDGYFKSQKGLYITHIIDGKQIRAEEMRDWVDHVVIFDILPSNVKYILKPIMRRTRVIQLYRQVNIIIVHSQKLSEVYTELADALSLCKNVYWIRNCHRDRRLFKTLNLSKCRQVIVCESRLQGQFTSNSLMGVRLPEDAPAMFLTVRLREWLEIKERQGARYVPVVTELNSDSTLGYLQDWNDERDFTNPLLAEGCVVTKRFAQLLLMQSQDNPYLVNVMNALMLTSSREGHAQVYGIRLEWMMKGRHNFSGETWQSVRTYFGKRKCVPIALYCSRKQDGGRVRRYTLCHPTPDTLVCITDRVIVLSTVVPEEIVDEAASLRQKHGHSN